MGSQNLSVDDILDEIKMKSSKHQSSPTSDMQRVDEIIKDILTKRQNEQIKKEGRDVTLREKIQLEEEIKIQTKSLTDEFLKLHPTLEKNGEPLYSSTAEIKLSSIAKAQKIKFRDTSELKISPAIKEKKEQKLKELQKSANDQHIIQDMKNITSHFGMYKNEPAEGEQKPRKAAISHENYKELKNSRNKKVDSFVIEHKKPEGAVLTETAAEEEPVHTKMDKAALEHEQYIRAVEQSRAEREQSSEAPQVTRGSKAESEDDFQQDYEYDDKSQTEEVRKNLLDTKKSIMTALISLGVLLIPAAALFFLKVGAALPLGITLTPSIYAFVNMGLFLIAAVVSLSIFSNSFASISEHKSDKDILYCVTFLFCLLANIYICLKPASLANSGVQIFTPVFVFLLFVNFFGKNLSIRKIIKNFDFISGDSDKSALTLVTDRKLAEDMTKGMLDEEAMLAKNIKVDFLQCFLKNSFEPDLSDRVAGKMAGYAPIGALLLAAVGYLLTKDYAVSITVASGSMIMLTSFIGAIFVVFPLHDTAGIVNHFSGMRPEYSAVDTYKETNSILIEANSLFPNGSIVLHGIKTFRGNRIDDAIIDAASVVRSANSVLDEVFLSIISDNSELLRPVDSLIYEDLMGISAWVDGKRVLIGNRELMINHSIAVPKAEYEAQYNKDGQEVVFLSNGGELCAAFILEFTVDSTAGDIVNLLTKNDIVAVIKTVDSCVTSEMIARVFDVESDLFKVLPARLHKSYEDEVKPQEKVDSILGNNGSVFGYIVSIVACKKLAYCTRLGSFMYVLSGIFGALLFFAMTILKTFGMMGNLQMFIFMAVFAAAFWVYEKNMKL